ncbi:hypothetical protein EDF52_10282 [Curtobacterium sp. PhB42]|uniref:hypothetical protein n=1 Tax=unclassified Curtobacterium TaxID=257496 RepID=UPI0010626D27|nr:MULTISPECIES: hypothetical protein [unclassified Curtobacterium]TDW50994.1 hypothetical protein EDF52_10282 [Curtobacterium sp. PhB42]TDW56160.1 hypothetical protein EDF47_104271 [Curtobacterium sp. PhB190]
MAAFIAGDQPVADFDFDAPEVADIEGASTVVSVAGQTLPTAHDGEALTGTWFDLTLPLVGEYPVYAVTTLGGRQQRTLLDTLVVVPAYDEWFNVVTARREWEGAPTDDGTLHRLLTVARDQVLAYAPDVRPPNSIPERYRSGQLMQARNTHNASVTNGEAQVDAGGYVVNVRPLDWAVKQLLRPQRAKKGIR